MTVDHQKLNDRLGTIVRSKEGKMVNVSARAPFTLQSAPVTAAAGEVEGGGEALPPPTARRPPVLTMTPARSMHLYTDSRYSSPSGSRSSSRRRPDSHTYSDHRKGKQPSSASDWFGDTESESSRGRAALEEGEETEATTPAVTIQPKDDEQPNAQSIAFSWSDT